MKNNKVKKDFKELQAEEPVFQYAAIRKMSAAKNISFEDFDDIAAKTDFTQKEWADILHISERTIQRYAKGNGIFNPNVSDRIYQIGKVMNRGKEVFGSYRKFLLWIREKPIMPEGRLSISSLSNFEGIQNLFSQLGRIEHGILA